MKDNSYAELMKRFTTEDGHLGFSYYTQPDFSEIEKQINQGLGYVYANYLPHYTTPNYVTPQWFQESLDKENAKINRASKPRTEPVQQELPKPDPIPPAPPPPAEAKTVTGTLQPHKDHCPICGTHYDDIRDDGTVEPTLGRAIRLAWKHLKREPKKLKAKWTIDSFKVQPMSQPTGKIFFTDNSASATKANVNSLPTWICPQCFGLCTGPGSFSNTLHATICNACHLKTSSIFEELYGKIKI